MDFASLSPPTSYKLVRRLLDQIGGGKEHVSLPAFLCQCTVFTPSAVVSPG